MTLSIHRVRKIVRGRISKTSSGRYSRTYIICTEEGEIEIDVYASEREALSEENVPTSTPIVYHNADGSFEVAQ